MNGTETQGQGAPIPPTQDRKSTRLNSSHLVISYAVFCLKKKNRHQGGWPVRRRLPWVLGVIVLVEVLSVGTSLRGGAQTPHEKVAKIDECEHCATCAVM